MCVQLDILYQGRSVHSTAAAPHPFPVARSQCASMNVGKWLLWTRAAGEKKHERSSLSGGCKVTEARAVGSRAQRTAVQLPVSRTSAWAPAREVQTIVVWCAPERIGGNSKVHHAYKTCTRSMVFCSCTAVQQAGKPIHKPPVRARGASITRQRRNQGDLEPRRSYPGAAQLYLSETVAAPPQSHQQRTTS